jgi:hypothetical protein
LWHPDSAWDILAAVAEADMTAQAYLVCGI